MTLIPQPPPARMPYSDSRRQDLRFELTLVDGNDGNAEFYPFDKTPTDMIV